MNLVEFQEKNAVMLKEATSYPALAEACVVEDAAEYEQAIAWSKEAKVMSDQITKDIGPMKTAANALHKSISQFENKFTGPLVSARELLKLKAHNWMKSEKKKADDLAIKAEAERVKAEKKLAEKIKKAKPGEVVAPPPPPPPAPIATTIPKVGGLHTRESWTYDEDKVDMSKLPDMWKLPNHKGLKAHAKTNKNKVPIPGVEFYNQEKLVG